MDLGLQEATAVVTGGSKGMGRAIAERLAAEGAQVAILARGGRRSTRRWLHCTAPAAFGRWGCRST